MAEQSRTRLARLKGGAVLYRTGPASRMLVLSPWQTAAEVTLVTLPFIGVVFYWPDQTGAPWTALIPLLLWLFGLSLLRQSRLEMDGAAGCLTLSRRSLLGTTQQSWPISRIAGVEVRVEHGERRRFHTIVLRLADPDHSEPLDFGYKYAGESEAIAATIQTWLDSQRDAPQRNG